MLSQRQKKLKVYSYCFAPECDVFLHCTKGENCFAEWHNAEYRRKKKKIGLEMYNFMI